MLQPHFNVVIASFMVEQLFSSQPFFINQTLMHSSNLIQEAILKPRVHFVPLWI